MEKSFKNSLFLFRRDLRLADNTGWIEAREHSEQVIPAFIFTPEQVENNSYLSDRALQFMIESLQDLEKQLQKERGKLYLFYGVVEKILKRCIDEMGVEAVFVNRDYTPYSRKRDEALRTLCQSNGVYFFSAEDALLHPPEESCKSDGSPYSIFTPFYKRVGHLPIVPLQKRIQSRCFTKEISFAKGPSLYDRFLKSSVNAAVSGGREKGLEILRHLKEYRKYAKERDFPALDRTTHLSAYLKFTVLSPREVYFSVQKHLGKAHPLIRQLYWRDFYTSIALFFPHVFGKAFRPAFDHLVWDHSQKKFQRWCEGETGFPLIDAGMRQINETGFMHNRVRMAVASFLVKDLHLPWQWGEKYFATRLIDYDPAVNNGNWQWVASTGSDAQPYFRVFNPWTQQVKFDPDGEYIRRWIPALASLDIKQIHSSERSSEKGYPAPMLDHAVEAKEALKRYRQAAKA